MSVVSWIDGLVLFCLAIPAIRGWQSGIVSGVLRLAGLLVGGTLGWTLPVVHGLAQGWRPELPTASLPWICAFACALLGWLLGAVVAWIWRRSTRDQPVGWVDRIAGLALGLSKGAAFTLILLASIQTALPAMRSQIRSSWTGAHAVAPAVDRLSAWGLRRLHPESEGKR